MAIGLYQRDPGNGQVWIIDQDSWQTRRAVTSWDELSWWTNWPFQNPIWKLPAGWFDSIPPA